METPITITALAFFGSVFAAQAQGQVNVRSVPPTAAHSTEMPVPDGDGDGINDALDSCPCVDYAPGFDLTSCGPLDGNPNNDFDPACKARERVFSLLMNDPRFVTRIAFAVIEEGEVHLADAFAYLGQGQYVHDPGGIHRLHRIGSTSKSVTATVAKILEERGVLRFDDLVDAETGGLAIGGPSRRLRDLLAHRGCFTTDFGALHLYCYAGGLNDFWADPDDAISPRFDSPGYGNPGGGYSYSAFNYSLAGTYMAQRLHLSYSDAVQAYLFDRAGMCTATLDGARARSTAIGEHWAVSQANVMDVGPYINQLAPLDPRCEDNFTSSDDLPGDPYSFQIYHLDEADAEARDPAGGVMASAVDLAWFARDLLASYHGTGGALSMSGVRELWWAQTDLGCASACPYEPYYGMGFFTDALPGQPVNQVGHGGSRPGYASAFVLRPEANRAVCILANADVSTVTLSDLAKAILDDFE